MEFKDYYATLGVPRTATHDEIKRAYRKLARKYHPDVTKEPDGEARFKEVAEAHETLIDPERRATYDAIAQRHEKGETFEPPPGSDSGFEFSGRGGQGMPGERDADLSDFFESLFGRATGRSSGNAGRRRHGTGAAAMQGEDHHAKVEIDLLDSYQSARRTITLRMPVVDASGRAVMQDRQLEVNIPKGVRRGQHLRLVGQGAAGHSGAPAGDLYLKIQFLPHAVFRLDERDIYLDLPIAPWEAALGATVAAPTPQGPVQLSIPAGSLQGRKLRLKGKGLPGKVPGDLYAVLVIAVPPATSPPQNEAYRALALAFADYNPRSALEAHDHG